MTIWVRSIGMSTQHRYEHSEQVSQSSCSLDLDRQKVVVFTPIICFSVQPRFSRVHVPYYFHLVGRDSRFKGEV